MGCEDTATEIVIKDGATGISENAFMNNTVIETATISQNVKYINRGAFANCTNLTEAIFSVVDGWYYLDTQGETHSADKELMQNAESIAKILSGKDDFTSSEYRVWFR